jgi:hypothetical protein
MKSSKVTHHPGYVGTVFSTVEDELETHTTDIAALEAAVDVLEAAGYVVGPASATDLAAARFDLTTGKLVQDSVLLIADTTGDISKTGGGGVDIQATSTNDSAPAGYKGEYNEAHRLAASLLTLVTDTATNITTISLGAGDWLVWGNIVFAAQGSTAYNELHVSISTTSATHDSPSPASAHAAHVTFITGQAAIWPTAPKRVSLSATTTVYLIGSCKVTGGSDMQAYGSIYAIRIR